MAVIDDGAQGSIDIKRPALWSTVEVNFGKALPSGAGWHPAIVVRHSGSQRFSVMTHAVGGILDSLSFSRLNMRVRMAHPTVGTRAKLRFLPDGEFMECIVAELLSPPPEVLLKLTATGEIFDSRTFKALGIEFQFRRSPALFEDFGSLPNQDGANSGEQRGVRYLSTSAVDGRRYMKQEKETNECQQFGMNGRAAESGSNRAKARQKDEPVEEVMPRMPLKLAASGKDFAFDHTRTFDHTRHKQRHSKFNFSENSGRKRTPSVSESVRRIPVKKRSFTYGKSNDADSESESLSPSHSSPEHSQPRPMLFNIPDSSWDKSGATSGTLSPETSDDSDYPWRVRRSKRRKKEKEEDEELVYMPSIVAKRVTGSNLDVGISPVRVQHASGSRLNLEQWIVKLCRAVAENFGVTYILLRGDTTSDPSTLSFCGLKAKTDFAATAFVTAFERIHEMSRAYTPSIYNGHSRSAMRRSGYTRTARNSYALGIVDGVLDAVRKKMAAAGRDRANKNRQRGQEWDQHGLRRSVRLSAVKEWGQEKKEEEIVASNGIQELFLGNAKSGCIELRRGKFRFDQKVVSKAHLHGAEDAGTIELCGSPH